MRIPEIKTAVADLLDANVPAFIWGEPGIGKSQGVAQVAADRGAAFVDIRLSMFDPVDLRGLPTIQGAETVWNRPAIWPTDSGKETVLFLDEMDRAPPAVLNAALQIVLDRRIGEHVLPASVRIVAAGNGTTDKGTNRLPGAAANRFAHLFATYDAAATREHFSTIGVAPEIVAFLHLRPSLGHISAMRADRASQSTVAAMGTNPLAWPSPRQWEEVSGLMVLPAERRAPLIAGLLGEAVAGEFAAFLGLYGRLPSIPAILADPIGTPMHADEPSLHYAVATALARAATRINFDKVQTYLSRLPRDFAVMGTVEAVKRDATLKETAAFVAWAARNQDVNL